MDGEQALRDFAQALSRVKGSSDLIRAELSSNDQEACALRSAGILKASPWFKDDKYLYLVFPTKGDGSRERRYVGADSAKIDESMAAISRAKRIAEIEKENDVMISKLTFACRHIDSLTQLFSAE